MSSLGVPERRTQLGDGEGAAAHGARHRAGSRPAERRGLSRSPTGSSVVQRDRWYVERVEGALVVSRRLAVALLALAAILLRRCWLAPDGRWPPATTSATTSARLLRHYAGEVYGGIVAIVGLVFLLNRRFTDLAVFFVAAVLVGWLVFSPDQVAERGTGDRTAGAAVSDGYEPIRSYQRIFRPERRIYQIEGRALPVPGGVPLRWLAYATAALARRRSPSARARRRSRWSLAALAGARGPRASAGARARRIAAHRRAGGDAGSAGIALGLLDWPLRLIVIPAAVATLATQATPDGRRADRFALSWLALRLAPLRRSLGRALPLAGVRIASAASSGSRPTSARPPSPGPGARPGVRLLLAPVAVRGRAAAPASGTPGPAARRRRRERAAAGAGRGRGAGGAAVSRFPLRYARRNVLIGPGGEAAALYRADTVAYPFLPAREKWALLHRLERFAHLAGADFSIWRVQRAYPAERYADELADLADPRHADAEGWRRYLEGHEARLRELGSHVARGLPRRLAGRAARAARARCAPSTAPGAGSRSWPASAAPRPISGSELEALAAAEQRTFDRLSGALALQRASTAELQWLLRRAACRGVAEPALDRALGARRAGGRRRRTARPPTSRSEHDLWRCANAPTTEDPGEPPSLVVEAEEGTSYQAFLCAGSLAEEAEFPGAAELLFAPGRRRRLPGRRRPARASGSATARRSARCESASSTSSTPTASSWRARAGRGCWPRRTASWRASTRRSCSPRRTRRCCGPRSRSRSALPTARSWSAGSSALRERFGEVALHRPRGLQHALFFDHLPAARRRLGARLPPADDGRAVRRDGRRPPAPRSARPTASTSATRPSAARGRSAMTRPRRRATARPSAVLLAGTLGSGKTLAAQAIAFAAQRRGSLVVDFDPKPDHGLDRVARAGGRGRGA